MKHIRKRRTTTMRSRPVPPQSAESREQGRQRLADNIGSLLAKQWRSRRATATLTDAR